jgi:hypothetical protein
MNIVEVIPMPESSLRIVADDGRIGVMDVRPYLESVAFRPLRNPEEFAKVRSGGYYVEWECGADLSADTIEARWILTPRQDAQPHSSVKR